MRRRRGGIVGIVLVVAYAALRFGFLAYREHEDGMSTVGIVESLLVIALGVFVLIEVVLAVQHARTRARERVLAERHPGAFTASVLVKRGTAAEVDRAAGLLGVRPERRAPRSAAGTLVADQHGIGLYVGGGTPTLLLGVPRAAVGQVGTGTTSSANRYGVGTVEALRVVVDSGGRWTTVDLPVYRRVVGFSVALHDDALREVVRSVAAAAQVPLDAQVRG
ncbi:hypothetical protein DEI93_05900 [Curtobacterium sp. MCBD17_035]|uniref:hypothetical protein n=1 Tax=Curtobacterium sp. MCBD17_035 TaxID=2175673 RepID=UPI000DAA462A|nr:hypothetical protein [Curtobacterium sp. MCBD17_035]WIB68569.1 hypothetical protein DEI93_05900 [Curtobacterium sp. MCBD17_035]